MNKFNLGALNKITDKVFKFERTLIPKSKKRICNKLKASEKTERASPDNS